MKYLATTQACCDWLLGKPNLIEKLCEALSFEDNIADFDAGVFREGVFRIAASGSKSILSFWNVDYLSGTGEEAWGFLRADKPFGISQRPDISGEIFERWLQVTNLRLQSLLVEGAWIHRAHSNGAHTCLSGRGSLARQTNIAYVEKNVEAQASAQRAILCVGPGFEFAPLTEYALAEAEHIDELVRSANLMINESGNPSLGPDKLRDLRAAINPYVTTAPEGSELENVEAAVGSQLLPKADKAKGKNLTYRDWISHGSPLTDVQSRILLSDAILKHPIRIVGPAGSGKTLLMQLLALRQLEIAQSKNRSIRVLYMVHNEAMAQMVRGRFDILQGAGVLEDEKRELLVTTLAAYAQSEIEIDVASVIDSDAHDAKAFQLEAVEEALARTIESTALSADDSAVKEIAKNDPLLVPVLARLVMNEISTVIKGHGLVNDRRRYVQSERNLSRFHGILNEKDRGLIFDCYLEYNKYVFEGYEVLDTDDIAISLLGRLKTPVWDLKRKTKAFDFVFVDETQLFNENERRIFSLLTRGVAAHIPIVLALDAAQDIHAQSIAGMAAIGIPDILNESLASIHRSTRSIIQLAFFVIQRSTNLFGVDFPDFTLDSKSVQSENHNLAEKPYLFKVPLGESLGEVVASTAVSLRRKKVRQICVVVHAEVYWEQTIAALKKEELPLIEITQRGQKIDLSGPYVAVGRPEHIGGQEFDAVIIVGLEQGTVPPQSIGNEALSGAIEQQVIREIYLSVTRARFQVLFILSTQAAPTAIIQSALQAGLIAQK